MDRSRAFAGGLFSLILLVAPGAVAEKQLLWGDTHLHTTYSSDAFANGNWSATPDTAYRYAKGMPVVHPGHKGRVQIGTPLDFLVVSDHAEFMGVIRNTYLNSLDYTGLGLIDSIKAWIAQWVMRRAFDNDEALELFIDVLPEPSDDPVAAARAWDPELGWLPQQPAIEADTWKIITDTADAHNAPGEFSALVGWEYSSTPGGANLHRVVVSDVDAPTAQTFEPFGLDTSVYPEDLWAWLERTSTATGGSFVAIPHNSNISKGAMFAEYTLRGEPVGPEYAETRRRWEPIVEITQIKGDSETHPEFSPDDPFADFEPYPYWIQRFPEPYKAYPGDFIRPALRLGLELESRIGINPFQFGVIGSTDAHSGLPSAEEDNFHGKFARDSIPAEKPGGFGEAEAWPFGWAMSASGLAAVWAEDNTREAILAAMHRREVYATTGPRIGVRFHGGWGLSADDADAGDFPANVAGRAVPMGGELIDYPGTGAPSFIVEASADPAGGTLDRIQIIKGSLDSSGRSYETVYNVAWAGADRLALDGSLAPLPDTVDRSTGNADTSTGDTSLRAVWQDPDFDPAAPAFYYVRVLQIPTARHSLLDSIALGGNVDTRRPDVIQERAYTSSIWYTPRP